MKIIMFVLLCIIVVSICVTIYCAICIQINTRKIKRNNAELEALAVRREIAMRSILRRRADG